MMERVAVRHGKYRIAVEPARAGGAVVARAYLGARLLYAARAASAGFAVAEARRWLNGHDRALRERRRAGRPTVEEYRRALAHVPLTVEHEAMLRAHAAAEARTVTARELAAAVGRDDAEAAEEQYDKLGRMVAAFIGFRPPGPGQRGQPVWTAALATPRRAADGARSWELFPEVAAALAALEPVWRCKPASWPANCGGEGVSRPGRGG